VESLLVFVQGSFIFTDFMVLDMQGDAEMSLILGRTFLSNARMKINVKMGPSISALGRRTSCSNFDQQKSNII
jgi:hypothetical protein